MKKTLAVLAFMLLAVTRVHAFPENYSAEGAFPDAPAGDASANLVDEDVQAAVHLCFTNEGAGSGTDESALLASCVEVVQESREE